MSVAAWSRDDAARYLGAAAQFPTADLLVSFDDVEAAFAIAIAGHEQCGCERDRRLRRAREILLGEATPLAEHGRLAL